MRLVTRFDIETYASQNPRGYRVRVALYALLGYAFLAGVLVVMGGLLALAVAGVLAGQAMAIVVGVSAGTTAFVLVRSLIVRFRRPPGIEVRRADCPRLFELLDGASKRLDASRVHRVHVFAEMNAAVVAESRFGPFGRARNHLYLGLLLLAALSPAELEAVVMHELGHLSKRHGRFQRWIYRLRQAWLRLLHAERTSPVLHGFAQWYAPRFALWSQGLVRAQELEADQASATWCGAATTAAALMRVSLGGIELRHRAWPTVLAEADATAEPTPGAFGRVFSALRTDVWAPHVARALADRTTADDTHPALVDRLAALGVTPSDIALAEVRESAAERYLGDEATRLCEALDGPWRAEIAKVWRQRHEEAVRDRARLGELDALGRPLTADERAEHAVLAACARGPSALPLLEAAIADDSTNPRLRMARGRLLLASGDDRGVADLDAAATRDSEVGLAACDLCFDYLSAKGRVYEAKSWLTRRAAFEETARLALAERATLSEHDEFWPHGLPAATVRRLTTALTGHSAVREAYLVRKRVTYLRERPCIDLVVVVQLTWNTVRVSAAGRRIRADLEKALAPLDGVTLCTISDTAMGLRKALGEVEGARIFSTWT